MKIALILDELSEEAEIAKKSLVLFKTCLDDIGYEYAIINWPSMRDEFLMNYKNYDLGIPVIHGGIGEGGQISAMFELLDIPYLFSDHKANSFCYDKYCTNLLVRDTGVHLPRTHHVKTIDDVKYLGFDGPYFIKPNTGGSSLNSGVYQSVEEAVGLIEKIIVTDSALVQEVIKGREFTVSLKGPTLDPTVVGIMEILTEREFFDYDAKYKLDKTNEIFPELSGELRYELEDLSTKIYKQLGLSDVARIDYLFANGKLYFLEVNTIPGMTKASFFPKCIKNFGYQSFAEFLKELIDNKLN